MARFIARDGEELREDGLRAALYIGDDELGEP
jgi:hypothetical protein